MNHAATMGGGTVYFPFPGDINRFYRIDGQAYGYYDPSIKSPTNSEFHVENGKNVQNWKLKS